MSPSTYYTVEGDPFLATSHNKGRSSLMNVCVGNGFPFLYVELPRRFYFPSRRNVEKEGIVLDNIMRWERIHVHTTKRLF